MEEHLPPDHGALAELLRSLLPETWRHDVFVTPAPPGFVLQFSDESGRRHTLDARAASPDTPALVAGEILAYSYTLDDPNADPGETLDAYRAALTAIAAREAEVVQAVAKAASDDADHLPEPGAPPAVPDASAQRLEGSLPARVQSLLPEAWRAEVEVVSALDGFDARFRDEKGTWHQWEARVDPQTPSLVRGARLGFSYLKIDERLDEASAVPLYRDAMQALVAQEDALLADLEAERAETTPSHDEPPPDAAAAEPPESPLNHYTAPLKVDAAAPFPDERTAPAALAALLHDALPEAWRREVAARVSPRGYTLRFRDSAGHLHVLDARWRRNDTEAFVAGEAMAYAYAITDADPSLVAPATIDSYRSLLTGLAAREAEILPLLKGRPMGAALHDRVRALLPEDWRADVEVTSLPPVGFAFSFRDKVGVRHMIETHAHEAGGPMLVGGPFFRYAHLKVDDHLREAEAVPRYVEALKAFVAHEGDLMEAVQLP